MVTSRTPWRNSSTHEDEDVRTGDGVRHDLQQRRKLGHGGGKDDDDAVPEGHPPRRGRRIGKLDADHQIVRDVGPRILRHVAKEVKHEQFYDLDVLTVTVDTRALV